MDQNEGSKDRLKIGISSCLLGNEVRFDGGHKKDYFLTGTLSRFVDYIPACPEVEIGLGIPRETLRLEKSGGSVRLVTNKTKKDITEKMRTYSGKQVAIVDKMDLDGYILKKDSPSCGMERMKVYSEKGIPEKNGRGVFAEVLLEKYPLLPVEEEGRLQDSKLRENFFTRVFAYARLKAFFSAKWTYRDLIGFHSKEKLLLMAHDNESYRLLGRMVAEGSRKDREELVREYPEIFMRALKKHATVSRNFNVLQHIWGFEG